MVHHIVNKGIKFALTLSTALALVACTQDGQGGAKQFFAKQQNDAIAQDFVGLRSTQGIEANLFTIEQTGVSTQPIMAAANNFINSLSAQQKNDVMFGIQADEWRRWSNVDNGIYHREGLSIQAMTANQRAQAFALLNASLSVRGMEQVRNIMKSEHTLKELNDFSPHLDEQLYFITIMGQPSSQQPWGWQFEGHHIAINYFVLGDQVVMTPVFMGAEPVRAESGKYKGNVVLQQEQDLGLALMRQLAATEQSKAMIGDKGKSDMLAAANKDNLVLDYQGICACELNSKQQLMLLTLIDQYIGKMRPGHAEVKMSEIKQHLDSTWFAWKGEVDENSVFYYRIHSPVILIEFDHQRPIAVDGPNRATRNHIHTMVRTPNGNDYGKDLLRQHLEQHHQ